MADEPKDIFDATDENLKCNRKIFIRNSKVQREREFYLSSASMGAPFSSAKNCTVDITSLLKG